MKYTAKFIDKALHDKYFKSANYVVSNVYAFHNAYKETDFLVANHSGYCYDIEVKVTRADFKADFKKVKKHSILEFGTYQNSWRTGIKDASGKRKMVAKYKDIKVKSYPNRFYFATPPGLITVDELPSYAGLLEVDELGKVTKVKEAKLLHKDKLNIEKLLCRKFYFRWMNVKNALEICKKHKK
jgi:hypothetical protein